MALIIITHTAYVYQWHELWHIARIGTPLFFLMSGFLYGRKNINNWGSFYFRRWKALAIPIYIWIIIGSFILGWMSSLFYTKSQYVSYLLNLQGIPFKLLTSSTPEGLRAVLSCDGHICCISWLNHLWFMTYLMFCFFALPLFQVLRDNFHGKRWWLGGWTPVGLMCAVSVLLVSQWGLNVWYFAPFMMGYFVNKRIIPQTYRGLVFMCVLLAAGILLRACEVSILDKGYDINGYYQLSNLMIVCGILGIIQYLFHRFPQWRGLPDVGNLTYCIFITHQLMLIFLCKWENQKLVAIPAFLGASLVTALVLQRLARWTELLIFPRKKGAVVLSSR